MARFGEGNPGKPKGALAKTTKLAKEAIQLAAEGLGGYTRLIAWAQEDPQNERIFWSQIYTKLLPLQVRAEINQNVKVTEIQRVIIDSSDQNA
jgi:hypothetical protein